MIILILLYVVLFLKSMYCDGSYDKLICKQSDASCLHQLHNSNANCIVKLIKNTACPIYSVGKTYDPFEVPFVLKTYIFKDMYISALNLTFPNPNFTSITFHYKNEWQPAYHLCRSFHIENVHENESLFWDCIMFQVSVVEGNFYTLELIDNAGHGGTYSFRVPTADDQGAGITKYRTFFYIHNDYFHNTGRLLVTIQASPFQVVSYNVSILSCVSNTLNCSDSIAIASYAIHNSEYEFVSWKTIDMGYVDAPGEYAVSVQLVSPDCNGNCAISMSSIFEIPNNRVLQIMGILAVLFFFTSTLCFAFLLKLKRKHAKHVQRAVTNPISVLFIYHPHAIERYKMLSDLKRFLQKECFAMPLLVDDNIGGQSPNQWTEQHMISAAKVIFFLPDDLQAESATPIKKQYSYALNYSSGCNFSRRGDRFCYVSFPDSETPSDTLYGLRSFSFVGDLAKIITWIHGESIIHRILYWRAVAKHWPNYEFGNSTTTHFSDLSNFNGILDESKNTDCLLPSATSLHSIDDRRKIVIEFDPDIPNVQTIT